VQAEVIYTTLGIPLFGLEDDELRRACFAVYNDWVGQLLYDPFWAAAQEMFIAGVMSPLPAFNCAFEISCTPLPPP
jgi:hypothetical protein